MSFWQDGVKMTLVDQSSMPADLQPATVVPGLQTFSTEMAGVSGDYHNFGQIYPFFQGGYSADFEGLLLNGMRIVAWSACCS